MSCFRASAFFILCCIWYSKADSNALLWGLPIALWQICSVSSLSLFLYFTTFFSSLCLCFLLPSSQSAGGLGWLFDREESVQEKENFKVNIWRYALSDTQGLLWILVSRRYLSHVCCCTISHNQALFYFDRRKAHRLLLLIKMAFISVSRGCRVHTVAIKFAVNCSLHQQTAKKGLPSWGAYTSLPLCLFALEHEPACASESQGAGGGSCLMEAGKPLPHGQHTARGAQDLLSMGGCVHIDIFIYMHVQM